MIKSTALLSPIFASLFWAIVFFSQQEKSIQKSKSYLGIFMLLAFVLYCSHAVFFNKLYSVYPYIESIYIAAMLSLYPMFYLYLTKLATVKTIDRCHFSHFLPALIFGMVSFITVLFMTEPERITYMQDIVTKKNIEGINISSLNGSKRLIIFSARLMFLLQVVYYAIKGIKLINSYNKQIGNYYSNVERKNLQWAKSLIVTILVVAIASTTFTFIGRNYFTQNEVWLLIPSVIFTSVLYFIGLKGNQQIPIKDGILISSNLDDERGNINNAPSEQLKDQLLTLFKIKKIYINPDLRISSLCELLGTNRTYISRTINEEFHMNFNEFVNKFRVEEAKHLLSDKNYTRFTMETIAEKSGFGSVNSFTRVFKESERITPGTYKSRQFGKFV